MGSRQSWIALAMGVFVAVVASRFPAATALRWFAPDTFRYAGVSGTIWDGSAELVSVSELPMRDLQWEIGGLSLLLGRVSGTISARLAEGFLQTGFSAPVWDLDTGSADLQQTRIGSSLNALQGLLPIEGAHGSVSVDLAELVLRNGWPQRVRGQVKISALEVEPFVGAGNSLIRLGDYEVRFGESTGDAVTGEISDTGGPLQIEGQLMLYPDRRYDLQGYLVARPQAQRELIQGLSIMLPEPDAAGRRAFSFPGSL